MFKNLIRGGLPCLLLVHVWTAPLVAQTTDKADDQPPIVFSGQIKPVIYVRDVLASQQFYTQVLGFGFESFHDYKLGKSVTEWQADYPPIYAEIFINEQKMGIHLPQNAADETRIGGVKLYIRVEDVASAYQRISARYDRVGAIKKTDWMDFFTITDPDGNAIILAETDPKRHSIYPW